MKITTRKGLCVSSSFTENFGTDEITPAKNVPGFKTFGTQMTDEQILNELGVQECTLEDVAAFLEKPPEGTDDGNWNIFYVRGLVVGADWVAGRGYWHVGAWHRDDIAWRAGDRVFSGNFEPQPQTSESLPSELVINGITYRQV